MFKLATLMFARDLRVRRGRWLLTWFGVATGVSVVFAVLTLRQSLQSTFYQQIDPVFANAVFLAPAGGGHLSDKLVEAIQAIPGIDHASGAVTHAVQLRTGKLTLRSQLLGVDLLSPAIKRFGASAQLRFQDDDLAFIAQADSVALSADVARRAGFELGDRVQVASSIGVRDLVVRGVFEWTDRAPGHREELPMMLMDTYAAALLMDQRDLVDLVVVETALDAAALRRSMQERGIRDVHVRDGAALDAPANQLAESFSWNLLSSALFSVALSIILIYTTMSHRVLALQRELSILRCLGTTQSGMTRIVLWESFLTGASASLAGLVLGYAGAVASFRVARDLVSTLYVEVQPGALRATVGSALIASAIGMGACLLGSIVPAWRAARTSPIRGAQRRHAPAMRFFPALALSLGAGAVGAAAVLGPGRGNASLALNVVGIVIACFGSVALLLVGLRVLARTRKNGVGQSSLAWNVACANVGRDPLRSVSAATALGLSVAVALATIISLRSFVDTFERWVQREVAAEIHITAGAPLQGPMVTPLTEQLTPEFSRVPGVRYVNPFRILTTSYAGQPIQLIGYDFDRYGDVYRFASLNGDIDACKAGLIAGTSVLITEPVWRRRGVQPGTKLALETPGGTVDFEVCAVVQNYSSPFGAIWMDRDRTRNDWNDRSVDTYDIFIEPGVDAREVQRRIADEFGTRYDLHVVTKAEFERLIIGTAKAAFYLTYAIVAVCVFIGLLHLSVAFLALARDRRHELNILRAMGAPTPDVVASFSLEASAVCLAGSILGAVAGVGLAGFGTTRFSDQVQGFVVTPHFDLAFILAVALLFVAVGVMASRRASRLQCEAADLLELSSDPS